MTINEKNDKCKAFFEALVNMLGDRYERISSCNNDASEYLCPVGTSEEISYCGKPERVVQDFESLELVLEYQ